MEPVLRPFRNRLRRRLIPVTGLLGKLVEMLTPKVREVRLQRMCPFCGLITSRHKTSCLECGRALKPA
jgi:ribosomal protein S27AE